MRHLVLTLVLLAQPNLPSLAGQTLPPHAPAELTDGDYRRAEGMLARHVTPLVSGVGVRPEWLADGRFWYRATTAEGTRVMMVDPDRRTRQPAFDHERLATAISRASGSRVEAGDLPVDAFLDEGRAVVLRIDDRPFTCDLRTYACAASEPRDPGRTVVASPDGRRGAFVRAHDLWVRDLTTGAETRLTHDGAEDFGYATNNAGWTRNDRPVVVWSPDSRRIATFQHDARGVGEMYLTTTKIGHPHLEAWKYPLPGDTAIFMIHRVIIDLDAEGGPRVVRLRIPPDAHRSSICDHVVCGGRWTDVEWTADGAQLAFLSVSRDHKSATLRMADAVTGEVRDVLEETVPTFFESGYRAPNWRVLPASNEVIWYSQRDDWGHLYLYELGTGRLKHRITNGDWNVLRVLRVDEERRTITFLGNERAPGDPYFQYLYRVDLDGRDLTRLTPDSANHEVWLAPSGRHFVDASSTPTTPPVTVLRDADGGHVLDLERGDVTRLVAAGWRPPMPFTVTARDGKTELQGLMFRPSHFDPGRRYPIINRIYPGPQGGSVGSRSFSPARADAQAMAELGFIVVQIDAMGTPLRSKTFHDAYYGNMGDNGLPDQVAGMRQLADRYPWIDLDRAGITGHSGGGFASTAGILRYPDFFKVAVSQAGNHDNRNYEDDWGEKWQGLLVSNEDGTTNYDNQANQLLAANLKGKLLLAHGTLDGNVPPYNTYLVVDALIAANKDFDLLMFPNRRHGFGNEAYMTRRRWDYFVEHLLGARPPKEHRLADER